MNTRVLIVALSAFTLAATAAEPKQCSEQIQFALRLHQSLGAESPAANITSSPLAVFEALDALREGATGKTLTDLNSLLGKPTITSWRYLDSIDARVRLQHSLGIWLIDYGWFMPEFVKGVSARHHAVFGRFGGFEDDDGVSSGSMARPIRQMNEWVSEETSGHITTLFTPENLTKDTSLVLASALYFNGKWSEPFEARSTHDDAFHSATNGDVTVPFMHKHQHLHYAETDDMQAVRLPYGHRGDFEFIAVLPREGMKLADLEATLTADKWTALMKPTERPDVILSLPKFSLAASTDLAAPLRRMGLKNVLGSSGSFARLCTLKSPLQLNAVPQQISVSIDETGTEVAAALFMDMRVGAMANPPPPKVFNANRPFLFAIRHRETGTLILFGRVSQPEASANAEK